MQSISTRQKRNVSGWGLGVSLALGLLFAACSSDTTAFTNPFTPSVIAATAPDTLSAGRPLDVKIHWRSTNGCQTLNDLPFIPINDSTFSLVVKGVETNDGSETCPEDITVQVQSFRLENPPQKRFTLEVTGASQRFFFTIEGGRPAAAVERHRVFVKNSTSGQGDPDATVRIISVPAGDTLAVMTSDANGQADTTLSCPPGGTRQYILDVINTRGRRGILEYRNDPAQCGVPEWAQVSI